MWLEWPAVLVPLPLTIHGLQQIPTSSTRICPIWMQEPSVISVVDVMDTRRILV